MPFRKLFTKIFLWFWLAVILLASSAVLVSAWIRSYVDAPAEHSRLVARMTQQVPAHVAVDVFEQFGRQQLRNHMELWEHRSQFHAFLFDNDGHELTGRTPPPEVTRLAQSARASGAAETDLSVDPPLAALLVPGRKSPSYTYVTELPPPPEVAAGHAPPEGLDGAEQTDERPGPPFGRGAGPHSRRPPVPFGFLLTEPQRLVAVIAAVIVTGGALCYWLARSLTRPLDQLRSAATRISEGDLSARVGPGLDSRKDEIGDLARDFDRMAERLQALISNERQLLRDISHELRSPLARLNIALGIAHQQGSSQVAEPLARIEHESQRLNELIQEVLTLARLESCVDAAQRTEVNLSEVLARVVSDAQFEAQARGVTVELANTPGCSMQANPELLRRAVENVIRNAVAYTTANTTVHVALHRLETQNGTAAEIVVRDHGKGVPDHALADLFRPFYRVEAGRERATGGVGLGLAITDRAVRAHGGTVVARNADDTDGGLMITITLPTS